MEKRKSTQPTEPSAGSVFMRPSPDFAVGRVIDELGLKGTRIGGAEISTKHAGFIINAGNASARDVTKLIKLIKHEVLEKHNIKLKTEIQFLKNR
jgi:UDP-N-acetylmuramate dehydrogenase